MASTITGLVPASLDTRVRNWLKPQVRGQQSELGKALEKAAVVKNGQAWVSKYVNGGEAALTVDHLAVIAEFFERSIYELLVEAGVTSPVSGSDQRSDPRHLERGNNDGIPAPSDRAHLREVARLRTDIARLETQLLKVQNAARDLAKLATVRRQGHAAARRRA